MCVCVCERERKICVSSEREGTGRKRIWGTYPVIERQAGRQIVHAIACNLIELISNSQRKGIWKKKKKGV